MKNKFITILNSTINNSFKLKVTSKKKKIGIIVLLIYLIFCFMYTFKINLNTIFETLKSLNLTSYFLSVIVFLASLFSFCMTFFLAKNILFQNKDNDLLLTLPLKKELIISTRLTYLYLYNLVLTLLCLIPGLYIYITNIGISLNLVIISVILVFFTPIIPTLLASVFGYLIAFLTNKFSKSNLFEYIFNLLFIGMYFLVLFNNNSFLVNIILNKNIKYILFPLYLINKSLINPLYIVIYIIFNLLILYLFIKLFKNIYFKLIINVNKVITKNNYNINSNKNSYNNKNKSLLKKEIRNYFSSFVYVFNTLIGPFLLILFTIYLIFDNKIITSIGKDIDIRIYIYLIITFVICLTNITCCSISMEKQNFYMLKTLPLSEKEILNSKLKLNILLVLPSVIFFLIVIYLKGYIKFYDAYLLLFYSCFLNLFVSMYGLIVNLKFPMFDALNDQIIVKRSTSVLIGTIVLTIICLCLVSFVMEYNVKYNHLIELSILIVLALDIILNFILNKWGIKRFRKL